MQKRKPDLVVITFIGYVLIGLIVFGYAAAKNQHQEWAQYAVCSAHPVGEETKTICFTPSSFDSGLVGSLSGTLWPLYLSWEIADRLSS